MSLPRALGSETIEDRELWADRKKAEKFDQCGLGEKAIYMGGSLKPRAWYVPYGEVTHVYRRVGESRQNGRGFLAPVLYIVVRFDGGREYQTSFRYLQDADRMMDRLAREHPEIILMSPAGAEKKKIKDAEEAALRARVLPEDVERQKYRLEDAESFLEKRPSLYRHLASVSRMKRRRDLIRPAFFYTAVIILIAGIAAVLAGMWMFFRGGYGSASVLVLLVGAAAVMLMLNSRVLPNRKTRKKALQKEYETAVADMERSIRSQKNFPLPARYAHPYTCERMIRILQEERAETVEEALEVLKEDLKKFDSSVALSGDDYTQVVTIKPMFLVADYR